MKLQILDLNKFKVLYWLYYERSLLKASERLQVTPSAVRQATKSLENSLGVQLFIVSGKAYIPTREAKEFLNLISPFFEKLEEKIEEVRDQKRELTGNLVVGSPYVYSYEQLTEIAHRFNQQNPRANIEITSSGTADLVDKVIRNELDFAISYSEAEVVENNKLVIEKISTDYLVLCFNPKTFKTGRSHLSYKDLAQLNHVAYRPNQSHASSLVQVSLFKIPQIKCKLDCEQRSRRT